MNLRCSDYIIGLSNIDFLRERLSNNQLELTYSGKAGLTKAGIVEEWQTGTYNIRILYNCPEYHNKSSISVTIHMALTGIPKRLYAQITESFPVKKIEIKRDSLSIDNEILYKQVMYIQKFSREANDVFVNVYSSVNEYTFYFYSNK